MSKWPANAAPLVSIRCTVYNQEQYVADCIEGFLIQETNFPFEICIHDDASPDKTADIIRKYEAKYPKVIKAVYETENLWSKPDTRFTQIVTSMLTGKYIAMCEGDDYWTDPHKLQRQVDFLESHPEYSLSAENGTVLFTETGVVQPFSNEPERDISLDELLIKRRFPTASVLFHRAHLLEYLEQDAPRFDTSQWAFLSSKGKIHYNPVISSVYRRGSGVTENNRIRWAYTSEEFNNGINKFYKPSKAVRKARDKILFYDFQQGRIAARKKGDKANERKLLLKTITRFPILFIKNWIKQRKKHLYLECIKPKILTWATRHFFFEGKKSSNADKSIIVSLTSYPARFKTLDICIKSLLNQKLSASKVVLYLSKDIQIDSLPKSLLKLQSYGLEIRNNCEDLKPHKKYFYAIQEFKDSIVVTADDDVIYPNDWLDSLYKSYLQHPNCISARRVHRITRDANNKAVSYQHWEIECKSVLQPSMDLIAIGVGGVLYPPHIFDKAIQYFNTTSIKEICLNADDIWLKYMETVQGTPVVWVPNKQCHPTTIFDKQVKESALFKTNLKENKNDQYIQACASHFNINL
ncbi:glycosyltransferase family 2 protein [Fibrobacter sp.]|uniref:glycosyltransferase family 2 protein n=1 Tax=Fibrobacter sp. TaxID=35828 RepID=UPI00386B5FE0